jgi:hypothetical protein
MVIWVSLYWFLLGVQLLWLVHAGKQLENDLYIFRYESFFEIIFHTTLSISFHYCKIPRLWCVDAVTV